MNQIIEKDEIKIENIIYEIRSKQVMLDSDLAKLYQVETKRINEAVKNNPDKFPERFSWKLTDEESNNLLVEISDQKIEKRGGKYKNPRVFTEQGIAMLSTVLKSKVATQVSIRIMDAFVEMKKFISNNLVNRNYIDNMVIRHDSELKLLQESFDKLSKTQEYDGIFFDGQVYDSYSILLDIFNTAKNDIVIIDNYIDKKLLDILRNIDSDILIITNKYKTCDYNKYKSQYNNIKLRINNKIHDRFIIIDNNSLYHIGASLKDLGNKCFAITKIENNEWLNNLLNFIEGIK